MSSDIEKKILRMGNFDAPPPQWHTEVDIAWANMGQPAFVEADITEFWRSAGAE
ncbi:hypothetical protein GS538_09245 [Rhodococcus hoagii]|nr:hypothetical protein [Prescottella equi]